jgi:hypothetical protein
MRCAFLSCILSAPTLAIGMESGRARLDAFLEKHCYECHDDLDPEADLDLLNTKLDPTDPANFATWERVFRKVESGDMPPKENKRPADAELDGFLTGLGNVLRETDRALIEKSGRVPSRRLTREEYEHTLHDLLGIGVKLGEILTADSDEGFTNTASSQQLSHFHLQSYLQAADTALEEAFSRALGQDPSFEKRYGKMELTDGLGKGNYRGPEPAGNEVIAWAMGVQFYGRLPATIIPEDGWYQVTVHDARGINRGDDGAVWATLNSGSGQSNEPLQFPIGLVEGAEQAADQTFRAWIRKGHCLILKPSEGGAKTAPSNVVGKDGGTVIFKGRDLEKQGYHGLRFSGITIQRIHPNGDRAAVFNNLFPGLTRKEIEEVPAKPLVEAKRLLEIFAAKAFRRPVSAGTLAPYEKLVAAALSSGEAFPEALRHGYHAILCSPNFLTFVEAPGDLDDHAIASRLSYMLWKSLPDQKLRQLANQGKLRDAPAISAQIDRLLADPKSSRFIESFTNEWLELRDIDSTQPDPQRFRTFDPIVQQSMLAETRAFVAELFREDLSVTHFLQSDFAFLNTRLKEHYSLEGVDLVAGNGLAKVKLPPDARSGLLTQGAVLKVTADGSVTSPVVRGVFVNERFLGQHIDPPPPNIPAIEPDIRGAVSIRDQLEKHRDSMSCASCHARIDPAGFALEEFDPVGNLREFYGRPGKSAKIDSSGTTPEGHDFRNFSEWRDQQLSQPDMLAEAFAGQLLRYGTGGEIRFSDKQALKTISESTRIRNHGLRSLLKATLTSPPFLEK